jgi:hypothetical protein
MRRKSLDRILSITGLVMAVVLAVAGALLMWGGNFAHDTVTRELSSQAIVFDEDPASLPPAVADYAGMAVTDGPAAEAYAQVIDMHMTGMADGKTYSQVSGEWIAGGRTDADLAQLRMTLFMGETLRGLLLNAYAFWTFGTIAVIAAWAAFGASALMFVLSILGFAHLRRTTEADAVFEPRATVSA